MDIQHHVSQPTLIGATSASDKDVCHVMSCKMVDNGLIPIELNDLASNEIRRVLARYVVAGEFVAQAVGSAHE